MKKALFTTFVVMLVVSVGFCGGKSKQVWNYEVPNAAIDIDSNDYLSINNGFTNDGVSTLSGATDISAAFTQDGSFIQEPPTAVVQLDTSTALGTLDSFVVVVGSNAASGAFAMTSDATPFIATTTATNGQLIQIMGTDATGTVTLSDDSQVSGSLLELDGNTVTLGLGSNLTLRYYEGKWWQCGGVNIID
jgi:hypothetical protein